MLPNVRDMTFDHVTLLEYIYLFFSFLLQLCRMLFKVDEAEMDLRTELRDLKAEQNTISMSDEFSKYFKLQRKIEKLGQDVKQRGLLVFLFFIFKLF